MKIQQILDRQGIIYTDPEIMSGIPVFVGTRVPLQTFFDYLEGESGLAEFLEDFPHLTTPALQVLEAIAKAVLAQERSASSTRLDHLLPLTQIVSLLQSLVPGSITLIDDAGDITPFNPSNS